MELKKLLLATAGLALAGVSQVNAAGWPAKYEGVMLQGFYWDSYQGTDNTKWATLTDQSDELAEYFKLIWVPNSAKPASNPGMGYDPVYWFTNHTSSFGTEAQLRTMISTFKEKGVGIIEDVVVNHRSGKSNWTDFPAETWNGVTYKLGPEHICSTDEVKDQAGQAKPTGAPDTGEDFNGSRDLDHTSTTVQDNIKAYCKFLLTDLGYAGFRYDMVKGYGAQYTKIYNQYSQPTYSVGEYWDGSYDAVKAWIDGTGKESAAFDFPFKYAVNDAFASGDYSKLAWLNPDGANQPAGMIHFAYQQYAVTFIDNHDTYRDGNKFNGNVVAANAFMLCSPGTPCVFWPHWSANKNALKKIIAVRNACGIHNQSAVKVLRADRDCYMAEVTGTKGTLVVKIGPAMVSPDGYADSDIKATGTDYCIWSKADVVVGGGDEPDQPVVDGPSVMYLVGNVNGTAWSTSNPAAARLNNGVYEWPSVTVDEAEAGANGYFSFITQPGANWDVVNGSDRYGATSKDALIQLGVPAPFQIFRANVNASSANSWMAVPGTYRIVLSLTDNTVTLSNVLSGVVEAVSEECAPRYFNLQGVEVSEPVSGLYIRVTGTKTEKVLF